MRLRVVTPDAIIVDEEVSKVGAEAADGAFTLLPRHVDFADECLLAIDGGVLVKRRFSVRVATPEAISGDSVVALQRALRSSFEELGERERQSRSALAHLETDAVRRLIEMGDDG
jgi:F-type H+-transporting ATPase subunit epsilon